MPVASADASASEGCRVAKAAASAASAAVSAAGSAAAVVGAAATTAAGAALSVKAGEKCEVVEPRSVLPRPCESLSHVFNWQNH